MDGVAPCGRRSITRRRRDTGRGDLWSNWRRTNGTRRRQRARTETMPISRNARPMRRRSPAGWGRGFRDPALGIILSAAKDSECSETLEQIREPSRLRHPLPVRGRGALDKLQECLLPAGGEGAQSADEGARGRRSFAVSAAQDGVIHGASPSSKRCMPVALVETRARDGSMVYGMLPQIARRDVAGDPVLHSARLGADVTTV